MSDILLGGQNGIIPEDTFDDLIDSFLDRRIIVLNNDIDDRLIEQLIMFIMRWNQEDVNLPVESRKPIKIYINSTGGDTFIAATAISIFEQSKTPIIGVNISLCASAAYHIYLACHKKYAFENSIFLQHDGEISISQSGSKARDTMEFIKDLDDRMKKHVLEKTNMTEEFYDKIYESEYWLMANKAKELGIVDKIIGQDCTLDEILE